MSTLHNPDAPLDKAFTRIHLIGVGQFTQVSFRSITDRLFRPYLLTSVLLLNEYFGQP